MAELLALGVSHKTAPLDLRERLSLTEGRAVSALAELTAAKGIHEAAAISTCNRTELYLIVSDIAAARDELSTALERVERQHDGELEATRSGLAEALERIDAVHRDAERLRERVGEVTVERHEGAALAGDDRRRLEELQREGEQARARLEMLRSVADQLREDSVRGAETTQALRAELEAVHRGDSDAEAAVEALRGELSALRESDAEAPEASHRQRSSVSDGPGGPCPEERVALARVRGTMVLGGRLGLTLPEHDRRERDTQLAEYLDRHEEAGEQEAVGGQAGQSQSGDCGAGTRDGVHRMTGGARGADQFITGIGDERRSGIADQRHCLGAELPKDPVALGFAAMIVIDRHRRCRLDVGKQFCGNALVFGQDQARAPQGGRRAG